MTVQSWPQTEENYKGLFDAPDDLRAAYRFAAPGDYAIIASTWTIWVWDNNTSAWRNSGGAKHARTHAQGGIDPLPVDNLPTKQNDIYRALRPDGSGGVQWGYLYPSLHHASHEDGGVDEISASGLSGLLADPQTPLPHAWEHELGGDDEIVFEYLPTLEASGDMFIHPDGIGGVEWIDPSGAIALLGLDDIYVPYTGAFKSVNLGSETLTTTGAGTFGSLETTVGGLTLKGQQAIKPDADSPTALNIAQADGTAFVVYDTTNKGVDYTGASVYASAKHLSDVEIVDGLVLDVPFQNGAMTRDFSENAQNGTVTGATYTPGGGVHGNGCYYFDGTGDMVYFDDQAYYSFTDGSDLPFTISCWIYPSAANGRIITKSTAASGIYEYRLQMWASILYFHLFSGGGSGIYIGRRYTSTLTLNVWQHITVTYDGSGTAAGIKIYRDGVRIDNADSNNGVYVGMSDTNAPLRIGGDWNTTYFTGYIDEVKLFDRVITDEEMVRLKNTIRLEPFMNNDAYMISPDGVKTFYMKGDPGAGTPASVNIDLDRGVNAAYNGVKFSTAGTLDWFFGHLYKAGNPTDTFGIAYQSINDAAAVFAFTPTAVKFLTATEMWINDGCTLGTSYYWQAGYAYMHVNQDSWVFNDSAQAVDFRIEGDTDQYLFYSDGANDRAGFGTSAPDRKVEINDANGENLRLTDNDANGSAVNYVDLFSTDGLFTITPSDGGMVLANSYLQLTDGQDIRPSADSPTALNIAQADGTDFVRFDTTNKRGCIGNVATLDATWNIRQGQVNNVPFTNPHLKLQDSALTNNTGLTSIALATSTADNYGISLSAWRYSTGGAPAFVMRYHFGNATGVDLMRAYYGGSMYMCPVAGRLHVGHGTQAGIYQLNVQCTGGNDGIDITNDTDQSGTYLNFRDHDGKTTSMISFDDNFPIAALADSFVFGTRYSKNIQFNTSTTGDLSNGLPRIYVDGSTGAVIINSYKVAAAYTQICGDTYSYLFYVDAANDKIGINTSGVNRQLSINAADGYFLRGIFNNAVGTETDYVDFSVDTNGIFTIDPTGGGVVLDNSYLKLTDGQDIRPSADSATALNIAQADGTAFVTIDTTNKRIGYDGTPTDAFHFQNDGSVATHLVVNLEGVAGNGDRNVWELVFDRYSNRDSSGIHWKTTGATGWYMGWLYNGGNPTTQYGIAYNGVSIADAAFLLAPTYAQFSTANYVRLKSGAAIGATYYPRGGHAFMVITDGASSSGSFSFADCSFIWNEWGRSQPTFRCEGDTLAYLFHIVAATDRIGVNSSAPDRKVEINDANGENLRLTDNDMHGSAAHYVDLFSTDGYFHMIPSDGRVYIGNGAAGVDYQLIFDGENADATFTWDEGAGKLSVDQHLIAANWFYSTSTTRLGDGTANYAQITSTGDITFVGSAGFYPRRVNQAAEPAAGVGATQIDTGELVMWRDTDDGKVYLVYNDTDSGILTTELT